MKWLFWFSIFVVVYAYFVYPVWSFLRSRYFNRPIIKRANFPKVSIVIAARNEARNLEAKLMNLRRLNYPHELLETIVVSDGSTDETNEILSDNVLVHPIFLSAPVGKAEALNHGIVAATGEILVFMDARQQVSADSIQILAEGFADPEIGCVSGALELGDGSKDSARGVGSYWKIEKAIRNWESESGSVVGATGALYAVRRSLVSRLQTGTILDDVFIPMDVARQGKRVIFEPRAIAWDNLPPNKKQEFRRKVRTLFGNYQLLRLAPWLLTTANPLRFEFISHKLVRLAVPFALVAMVLSSALLSEWIYRLPLVVAITVAALGALSYSRIPLGFVSRITDLALAFVLLNTAAIVAFIYFSVGKKQVWVQ